LPNIEEVLSKIPACKVCDAWNRSSLFDFRKLRPCLLCYNWDITRDPLCTKISHKYLLSVLEECNTACLKEDSPSFTEFKKYVTSKGLNVSAASNIWEHANNVKLKESMLRDENSHSHRIRNSLLEKMIGPKYEQWTGSPLWHSKTHDIEDLVDVPMHLLFLGIVKSTISYVYDFLKLRRIKTPFNTLMKRRMSSLINYKLSWLPLLEFKNDDGGLETIGWLSENYISFSRVFLWFVSSLRLANDQRTFRCTSKTECYSVKVSTV